jgi:hydroxyacylglutathione hydrolase
MLIKRLVVGELATNCYLVGCEETGKAALVDPGADPSTILGELALGGWSLELIILTHAHFDHFGAVPQILEQQQVPVAIGKADAKFLSDPSLTLASFLGEDVRLDPDLQLEDGQQVKVGNLKFDVLNTPGHTPGGICLLGEGILLTGDTLFAGSVGRTDFEGGSLSLLKKSLERLQGLPRELQVLPGHGPVSTMGQELENNPYLI